MTIKLSPSMVKEGYCFLGPFITPEVPLRSHQKAKEGGLDVIQTYVFWNGHEPSPDKYYFEGNYDLVKFIKLVQQAGLYVHLRIGPYAFAEWNFGTFQVSASEQTMDHLSFKCKNLPQTKDVDRSLDWLVYWVWRCSSS